MESKQTKDLAFNLDLCAYDTGKPNREKASFIRIRTNANGPIIQEFNVNDTSGAGEKWSRQERRLKKVRREEVVGVLGELIPMDAMKLIKPPGDTGNPDKVPEDRIMAPIPNTLIVVRRMMRRDDFELFVLVDKKHGLCALAEIPGNQIDQRFFYYSEWTNSLDDKTARWQQICRQRLEKENKF